MSEATRLCGSWPRFRRCYWELVENSPEVCWEVHREFTDKLSGAHRVFIERMLKVRWEFIEGNQELVENSPEVCQEVYREFADRLSGARWEHTGSSLEKCWEFVEGNWELVGGSSKGC
ncbi:hypothetical protein BHE74_00047419 [Ensete ventricosum]|nr:hypothetical protein BHE74_00047419 [Ensete ventricosum]RZS12008.1 hypothetical protein BHM03_00043390 [Ensete ventricosum]